MPKILAVHITDGFIDDCDELIQRCVQTDTLNYQVFCNIWKDMNFALVFQGRVSGAEVAELSEGFLEIAKRYMLGNSSNFEESVAGLFLVYALLHLQPYKGFAPLRITPSDLEALSCLEEMARRQRRHDVLYILGSVLVEGPVQWHLAEKQYGIERSMIKDFDVTTSIDRVGVRPKGVFYRHNEEMDLLRELSGLSRRYSKAKAAVTGSSEVPHRTLNYVDDQMAHQLGTSLKVIINGNEHNTPTAEQTRSDAIQKIKQRAMADAVHQMKHLVSSNDKGAETPSTANSKRKKKKKLREGKWKKAKGNLADGNETETVSTDDSSQLTSDGSITSPKKGNPSVPKIKCDTNTKKSPKKYGKKNNDNSAANSKILNKSNTKSKGKITDKLKAKNKPISTRKVTKNKKSISSSSESDMEIDLGNSDDDDDVTAAVDNDSDSFDNVAINNFVNNNQARKAIPVSLTSTCGEQIEIEIIDQVRPRWGAASQDELILPDFIEIETNIPAIIKETAPSVGGNVNKPIPGLKKIDKKEFERGLLKSKLGRSQFLEIDKSEDQH